MNLIELSRYLNNEELAEAYLYEKGILKKFEQCPYCGCENLGNIRRGRIKCYRCKKEWHKRKESFLESKQISCSKLIALVKLYSDEVGINKITYELDLDKKTVISIHTEIRKILMLEINPQNKNTGKSEAILYEESNILQLKFDSPGDLNHRNLFLGY